MTAAPNARVVQGAAPRRFPVRTCVACRTERQKRDLVRVVRTPESEVIIDDTGRANGRGAYLCADGSCWAAALKKKSIERALGVPLSAEVRARLEGDMTHGS
jgi:hypothetical protein